ncbi:MAG: hypothetical protein J6Y29_05100 [Clostridiales bacterium]|nr:hypothetical protein [Clostridiales bacterium]
MRHKNAFTLIEFIIVLFLFFLFTGLCISSLFSWTRSAQIKSDSSVCSEMKDIITKGIKSNDIEFEYSDYSITWTSENKEKIRQILVSQMGKVSTSNPSMVKTPKQDSYAFFVYLMPPYTVICLPVNSVDNIDTVLLESSTTDSFLKQRYPNTYYPQIYTYEDGNVSIKHPIILNPDDDASDIINKPAYIGCINVKSDFH